MILIEDVYKSRRKIMSDLRIRGLDAKKNANFKAKFENMTKEDQIKFFDFANENKNKVVDRKELDKAIALLEKLEAEKAKQAENAAKFEAKAKPEADVISKEITEKYVPVRIDKPALPEVKKVNEVAQDLHDYRVLLNKQIQAETQRVEAQRIEAEKKANAFKPFKPIPSSDAEPGTLTDAGIYTTKKGDNLTKIIKGLTEDLKPAELDKLIKAVHADNKSKKLMGEDANSIYAGQKLDLSSIKDSLKKSVVTTPATGKAPATGATPTVPALTIPTKTKAETCDVTDITGKKAKTPYQVSFDMTKESAKNVKETGGNTIVKKYDNGKTKSVTTIDPVTKKPVEQIEYNLHGVRFKNKWEYTKDGVVYTENAGGSTPWICEDKNPEDIYDRHTYNKLTMSSKDKDIIVINRDGDDETGTFDFIHGADERTEINKKDGSKTEYVYDKKKDGWVLKSTTPAPATTSSNTKFVKSPF